jgi:hypothetical protein
MAWKGNGGFKKGGFKKGGRFGGKSGGKGRPQWAPR